MLRVAVVGARRRRSGLGEFMARLLHELGTEVAGVVGRTRASAAETAAYLKERYGVATRPYESLPALFRAEGAIDAVAIASPHEAHLGHLREALEGGAHTLCEKPLLWGDGLDLEGETRRIAEAYRAKGRLLFLNAQWPQILPAFRALHPKADPSRAKRFEMGMSPPNAGPDMIPDAVPHAISLLLAAFGRGEAEGLRADWRDAGRTALDLSFRYVHARGTADCLLRYAQSVEIPRPAHLAFDGARIDRVVRMPAYEVGFSSGAETRWIEDPLKTHIRAFLDAIQTGRTETQVEDLALHSRLLARIDRETRKA